MPSRFLEEIGNPFVIGGHPSGYLVAAASPELIEDKTTVRGYVECRIKDRTGRFVIPNALRDFAELEASGEATVVGVGDEVEIWNKRRWDNQARLGNGAGRHPSGDHPSSKARATRMDSSSASLGAIPFGGGSSRPQRPTEPQSFEAPTRTRSRGATVTQKSIYGQPYIEVEGDLGYVESDKVLARLETALRGKPRTIFLDLRNVETVNASFLMAMEPTTYQIAGNGGKLAVLTERQDVATLIHRICNSTHTRVFPNLEAAMWWLVDEGHA